MHCALLLWTHAAAVSYACDMFLCLQVLVKGDLRLDEAIAQHVSSASADLLVMGSHNLCAAGAQAASAHAATAAAASAGNSNRGLQCR